MVTKDPSELFVALFLDGDLKKNYVNYKLSYIQKFTKEKLEKNLISWSVHISWPIWQEVPACLRIEFGVPDREGARVR